MILIVGLGNPEKDYEQSRHNTGFIVLDYILSKIDWKQNSGTKALYYKNSINKKIIEYIKPQTFMNNSGVAVSFAQTKHKIKPKDVIVIYDDIDLPIGNLKISFNRGSGGHKGIESIIKKIKSREFVRIRIGISPQTPTGKLRKPKNEQALLKFLLGKFKEDELKKIKKISVTVREIIEIIIKEGKDKAMSLYN